MTMVRCAESTRMTGPFATATRTFVMMASGPDARTWTSIAPGRRIDVGWALQPVATAMTAATAIRKLLRGARITPPKTPLQRETTLRRERGAGAARDNGGGDAPVGCEERVPGPGRVAPAQLHHPVIHGRLRPGMTGIYPLGPTCQATEAVPRRSLGSRRGLSLGCRTPPATSSPAPTGGRSRSIRPPSGR